MIHYNVWFAFHDHVEESAGLTGIREFLDDLHLAGGIAGYQILKNSGKPPKSKLLPFQALIEFNDDAQFGAAFSAQAAQGIHTGLHGRVMSLVADFQIEVFRQVATSATTA